MFNPTWAEMRDWAEGELIKARVKNDRPDMGEVDTALTRGEIRVLKRFLDLPNQATRGLEAEPD